MIGLPAAGAHAGTVDKSAKDAVAKQWGMLNQYCVDCHNFIDWAGGVAFDTLQPDGIADNADVWEHAVRKLRGRMMPPPGKDQPSNDEVKHFISAMEAYLDEAAGGDVHPGSPPPHRLNRTEYANAIEDVLGLSINPEDFLPKEVESEGFTNIAAVLKVSPSFIDQYVNAADILTTRAVGDRHAKTESVIYRAPETANQNRHIDGLPFGTRGGLVHEHFFPADGDYEFSIHGLAISTYIKGLDFPTTAILTIDGKEIFRDSLGGPKDLKEADQRMEIAVGEINARFQKIRRHITAGPHQVGVTFIQRSLAESDEILHPFVPDAGLPRQAKVDRLEIVGPFSPDGVAETPSRKHIFVCYPQTAAEERPCAEKVLRTAARRAYRRDVTDADMTGPMAFYDRGAKNGSFEGGIQQALMAILSSPKFLYRAEFPPKGAQPGDVFRISDNALASRLSFFLWSRQPDDELIRLAGENRLHEPKVLRAEVKRMLADPKAMSLVTDFAFQWLNVSNLDIVEPDPQLFPEFDHDLRDAFIQELKYFVASILLEDHSVTELLTSDVTFVNGRLADHYGIDGVQGDRFQRIKLTDSHRFGLLGKGGILMATSYANRTAPVVRGAYILERILGTPPSPPPPNVEAFPENEAGQAVLTVRERLARHRADPSCNACHGIMDPLGLALENFNAIGQWRDVDRYAGSPIDATGKLVDGTPLNGPDDLRKALASHPADFAQTFTEKLMTFALGRALEYYDMPTVRRIVRDAKEDDYRFSSILMGIVQSDAFQKREFISVKDGGTPQKEAALHD